MAKVILDPGHGGNDIGGVCGFRYEKNDNLRLALAVGEILQNNGIEVVYTRKTDDYVSPVERVNTANQEGADLYVGIYRTTGPYPNALSGVRAYIYESEQQLEEVAKNVLDKLVDIGFYNWGIMQRQEDVTLKDLNMPHLILDVGFINSYYDNELFDTRFDDIANSIALGIIETLGSPNNNQIQSYENQQPEETVSDYRYRVQVGLFRNYNNAVNLQCQLYQRGYQAQIIRQGDFYSVQVGDFDNLDDAANLENTLRMLGYDTLLIAV
jgi:N-acetylmuramoyl-L-alanine amidase